MNRRDITTSLTARGPFPDWPILLLGACLAAGLGMIAGRSLAVEEDAFGTMGAPRQYVSGPRVQ
jgi:hypothetical protein